MNTQTTTTQPRSDTSKSSGASDARPAGRAPAARRFVPELGAPEERCTPPDGATRFLPIALLVVGAALFLAASGEALPVPIITVDPDPMTATQQPDETTVQTLTIGNDGGVDLDWEIEEAPVSVQLGLAIDDRNVAAGAGSPFSLVLDAGVADTAIGVGGAQFVWLNRFTPKSYNFPITIDEVQVMFGSNVGTGGINVGEWVDIYLYEDADGDPSNGATHRASLNDQAVQAVNGTTWSIYSLPTPVTFKEK